MHANPCSIGGMAPVLWFLLGGAAGAVLTAKTAMFKTSPRTAPAQLQATAGAWATGGARGDPYVELQQWARSNPDFLAWAKAQGSGWTGLLDAVGEWAPDYWHQMASAYSVQMNYMSRRWPNGMALLNAALAAPGGYAPGYGYHVGQEAAYGYGAYATG